MVIIHVAAALAAVVAIVGGTEPANGTLHGNVRDPQGAAVTGDESGLDAPGVNFEMKARYRF